MKFRVPAIIIAALLISAVAYAHHSFAGTYIEGKLVKLEGDVVEFNIRNPHSFIVIEVTEKDGKKVKWGGEWGGVTQLSQGGVNRFTLEVGDHLLMEGAPARDSTDKKILVRKVWRPATDKKEAWEWAGNVR
jgi:Lhr-like helicase